MKMLVGIRKSDRTQGAVSQLRDILDLKPEGVRRRCTRFPVPEDRKANQKRHAEEFVKSANSKTKRKRHRKLQQTSRVAGHVRDQSDFA
jgi:hypothetical protein